MKPEEIEKKLREAIENYDRFLSSKKEINEAKEYFEQSLGISFEPEIPFVVGGVYEYNGQTILSQHYSEKGYRLIAKAVLQFIDERSD